MPYLCGLWRFANAYILIIKGGEKMKTCSERNEQRINSLQLSESLEDEIKELDGKNVEAGDVIFTTDTSSFLTIVCC
jgi:hypothetical protein